METDDTMAGSTCPPPLAATMRSADHNQRDGSEVDEPIVEQRRIYELPTEFVEPGKGFRSTWMDQDTTGDFDPNEESRLERLRRNQAKARSRRYAAPRKDSMCDSDTDDESPSKVFITFVITLKFKSESGKPEFTRLVQNLPAKPEATTQPSSSSDGYELRKRKPASASQYTDNCDKKKSRFTYDLPKELTGHPLARGCWECVALGKHECSLLSDEHNWPCVTCLDDDNDCELITQPVRKRACEHCKRRRNACSFSYTLNHGESCQQCVEEGHRCIAGPAKDAVRTRLSIERGERVREGEPLPRSKRIRRKDTTCVECDEANIDCTLARTTHGLQPCESCLSAGDPCTLASLAPQGRLKATDEHVSEGTTSAVTHTPVATVAAPVTALPDQSKSVGKVAKVTTRFCHPIKFNHVDKTGEMPCHFCTHPGFAIYGFESKVVEVIEWADGRGLEEVSGGHKSAGMETTRVCTTCTLNRLPIIMCSGHNMRPFGAKTSQADAQAARAELIKGKNNKARRWCSVCRELAQYECRTASEIGRTCGLQLCQNCSERLTGTYNGHLQRMLTEVKGGTDGSSAALRADSGFLREDGLLMRYVLWYNK